jgi:hypothetical protein
MQKAKHEQQRAESYLDRMQAASLGVPEGAVRDQFTGFVVQVRTLFEKHGVQSEEEFLGVKWNEGKLPDLDLYRMLIDKLNEILDTMELVVDDFEHSVDVSAYEEEGVEIIQGDMFIRARDEKGSVVLNQQGEVVIRSNGSIERMDMGESTSFLARDLAKTDQERKTIHPRVLYDLDGTILLESNYPFIYNQSTGLIGIYSVSDDSKIFLDRQGEPLMDKEKEVVEERDLIPNDESYHLIFSKETERFHVIDRDARPVGKDFDRFMHITYGVSGEYIGRITRGEDFALIKKDGAEVAISGKHKGIFAAGELVRMQSEDENGYPVITDEQGAVIFDSYGTGLFSLQGLESATAIGDKLFFVFRVLTGVTQKDAFALIDQDGKMVEVYGGGQDDEGFDQIDYLETIDDKAFFEVTIGKESIIIDQTGKIYAGPSFDVKTLGESEGKFFFGSRGADNKWVVQDSEGAFHSAPYKSSPRRSLSHNGKVYTVWQRIDSSTQMVSMDKEMILLSRGREMDFFFDESGKPYFIGRKSGEDALMDSGTGSVKQFGENKFLGNVVSMKDKIIFLVATPENCRVLMDSNGKMFCEDEQVVDFEKFNEDSVVVVSKKENMIIRKVVKV